MYSPSFIELFSQMLKINYSAYCRLDFFIDLRVTKHLTNMKRPLLFLCFITLTLNSFSQNLNLGVATGITNYFGDLGNDEFFQGSSTAPGVAVTVRNLIQPKAITGMSYSRVNLEARASWHRIGYDETAPIGSREGKELRNYNRGLSFRTDVIGMSSHVTYTFFPNRRLPLHRQHAAMYVFAGLGVYYANPKADLFNGSIDINNRYYFWSDGYVHTTPESAGGGEIIEKDGEFETNLLDWKTESAGLAGESYNKSKSTPWHIGVPMGFGFRYGINKKLNLSFEFGYNKFFSDYLDDVSKAYPTSAELDQAYPGDLDKQVLAKYISDPTDLGGAGGDTPSASPRGNPNISDSYSFINIEISYNLRWHPERLKTALLSLF